ncbi:MAG: glycerophosphodiester phosphodiesterase [Rhodocyclaceae bacterium]|nr:glycerophosphodiester phosphodiesterase [Rhodocyclaceae bacterium]
MPVFIGVLFFAGMSGYASVTEVQGHRGARGLLPENTLPAFAKALELGVDVLELDTGITKDGVVVISHDPCLNPDFVRDASGNWIQPTSKDNKYGKCIVDLTFDELQRFDVGRIQPNTEYAKRFATQQPIDGTRIPTLAALFAQVKQSGNAQVRFNIETKLSPMARSETVSPQVFVEKLLAVIRENGMASRVTIQSFDWRTLQICQRLAPDIPTVYLTAQQKWMDNIGAGNREGSAWTAGLNAREFGDSVPRMVKAAGGQIWSPHFGDVTPAKIAEAHSLGLKVSVWTVNEPKDIQRMLDWKVDSIISDYPDRVLALRRR